VRNLWLIATLVQLASFGHELPLLACLRTNSAPLFPLRPQEAIILGAVEGVTEFLPISSTGHLIITTDLLDLNAERVFLDDSSEPLWLEKPSPGKAGVLLTPKPAIEAYIVVIQLGAIAAIAPICWSQIVAMFRGLVGRDPVGLRLFVNLIIAFLPAAGLGVLIHDWIDENLFSMDAVIFGLVCGSVLMFFANLWPAWLEKRRAFRSELTPLGAAGIGLMQCLAMWPGTSRPMMTIVGGYFAGLPPRQAAGFSFLLGFVTLIAATLYKGYKSGPLIIEIFGWPNVALGIVVAAITASISVRFFVKLLLQKGLSPFAWYRLALAALLFLRS
jgi:undecaprenyl-diphosphatase